MRIETIIININAPAAALFCDECRQTGKPRTQTRLTAQECGQSFDYLCWTCPNCGQSNFTEDDLSILDAEIIEEG